MTTEPRNAGNGTTRKNGVESTSSAHADGRTIGDVVGGLIDRMTVEQKASLCSGRDFWNLKGIDELGIPSIMMTDGPHGVRKQAGEADHVGLNDSVPATCFPTAVTLASTWNTDLIEEVGSALGEESLEEQVAVLLGPGANIKRSPLCGRNFEYFSEDPFVTGRCAAAFIRGVQCHGVGTSLKHFAANNQESRRMTIDAVADERAVREIYLAGFEYAVRTAQPATVMCAYNRLNGTYCSEHHTLLTSILKEEWGHTGLVVTDWGAVNDRVEGLKAGLELEMPGSGGVNDRLIAAAVRDGRLDEAVLDRAVTRILELIFQTRSNANTENVAPRGGAFSYDRDAHHRLARRAAAEGSVLLKNEGALPLAKTGKIVVIGAFAKTPRYQGSGSSLINPHRLDSAWDALHEATAQERENGTVSFSYAEGYDPAVEEADERRIAEAVECARDADHVVVFAGLPEVSESEGFDRPHLSMPDSHNRLIDAVAAVVPRVVVVLSNGSPVTMPWLERVDAVVESYLGGQAWGGAAADILFGAVNPSGKLAETFPLRGEDVPAAGQFPGGTRSVVYTESIYVGYRYYDTAHEKVLFPFGHGLSYTTFLYDKLEVRDVPATDERGDTMVEVEWTITNTGPRAGREVAQVYVAAPAGAVFRPAQELKGFASVYLEPGETKKVTCVLDRRAFSYWDSGAHGWVCEAGLYEVRVGASSRDLRLRTTVTVDSPDHPSSWAQGVKERAPGYQSPSREVFLRAVEDGEFAYLLGRAVPPADRDPAHPFDRTSTFEDVRTTPVGRRLYKRAMASVGTMVGPGADEKTRRMMEAMIAQMPLRNMSMFSGGGVTPEVIDALILLINGKYWAGWRALRRARRNAQGGPPHGVAS